ncbi:MAG: DUF177 domain-containing protein [candidate division KSB1 bacterium]|nr:DUF177 domain-containing protein [candidate division KSB1 bacterium]
MKIPITGLSEGLHVLNFVESLAEFGLENHPHLRQDVHVRVELEKRSPKYFLKNDVRTIGHFFCDRCLVEFDLKLSEMSRAVFTTDAELIAQHEDEEVYYIDPHAKELDIAAIIRDTLLLSIPMKRVCSSSCRGFCAGCGANLNEEKCRCAPAPPDPRWQKLRKMNGAGLEIKPDARVD